MFNNNNKNINENETQLSLISNIMKHNSVGIGNIEIQHSWNSKNSFQENKWLAENITQD